MNAFHIAVENSHLDITAMLLDAKPDLIHTKRNVRDVHRHYFTYFPLQKYRTILYFYFFLYFYIDSSYFGFNKAELLVNVVLISISLCLV